VTCRKCGVNPSHSQIRWIGIIGLSLLLEAEGLRRQKREHTLSHATRTTFRTNSKPGKTIFIFGWTMLYWWFLKHVLKVAVQEIKEVT
jgi:hypothetical protein